MKVPGRKLPGRVVGLFQGQKSELKLSTVAGGGAALPLLLDLLKDGGKGMSEEMKIALIAAVTLIVVTYNISRGMAKTEVRGEPKPPAA